MLRRTVFLSLLTASALNGQQVARVDLDTVRAGVFDFGKMWTFEYPPTRYFTETYGFNADAAWFERARSAALRLPGCSAAFVSPNGLIGTNHHCVRGTFAQVSRPGENLLDDGFFATSVAEERAIRGLYVDQLIAIRDISDEVFAALEPARSDSARQRLRRDAFARIGERLRGQHAATAGDSIVVQLIPLYHGGRYSAYVFRRHTDLRLVAAPELQLGFFGGDPDNFTYPRYALDFAFLRAYGPDGRPLRTPAYFRWAQEPLDEGDVVFVIGNPGNTSRLLTMAQLEVQRDVVVPANLEWFDSRLRALREFYAEDREAGEAMDIRNLMFGLSNSLKAYIGRSAALADPVILARKADAERQLEAAIQRDTRLRQRFGDVIPRMAGIQKRKLELASAYGAYLRLSAGVYSAPSFRRALLAQQLAEARAAGAPADTLARLQAQVAAVRSLPPDLERRLLAAQVQDFVRYLGPAHPVVQAALQGRRTTEAVPALLASVLADSAALAAALAGAVPVNEPLMRVVGALSPSAREFEREWSRLNAQEAELAEQLGRARFEIYGTDVPPDATFSPRITDGVIRPYEYNGTIAPPWTTLFGLYDHYFSYGEDSEWDLPPRWLPIPPRLDLNTILDFISTSDTIGGNSGSPAVTPDLEVVGFNFDRNIEGLSRDYIYLPDRGRNIMVSVFAVSEALDDVYDADRVLMELRTGTLYETEAAADAATR